MDRKQINLSGDSMKGHSVGYIRVSSYGQNTDRQLSEVPLDKVFEEKASAILCDQFCKSVLTISVTGMSFMCIL